MIFDDELDEITRLARVAILTHADRIFGLLVESEEGRARMREDFAVAQERMRRYPPMHDEYRYALILTYHIDRHFRIHAERMKKLRHVYDENLHRKPKARSTRVSRGKVLVPRDELAHIQTMADHASGWLAQWCTAPIDTTLTPTMCADVREAAYALKRISKRVNNHVRRRR